MKWIGSLALFCSVFFSAVRAEEFPVQVVLEMAGKDDQTRVEWATHRDIAKVRAQEIENTAILKQILERHGLPTEGDVDDDEMLENVVDAIEQLVLRSSDLAFQKQFLEKTTSAGDAWNDVFDVLTDRILVRQGLSQRYATHFYHEEGVLVPYPVEDMEMADEWAKERGEPSFAESLEVVRQIDQALAENKNEDLYKINFNSANGFYKKASDYLYCATFESDVAFPEESFLAFEDLGLAASFALRTTSIPIETTYKKTDTAMCLETVLSPQSEYDIALLIEAPLYVYLVPRSSFQPYQTEEPSFANRIFTSSQKVEPAAAIACDCALEALAMGGSDFYIRSFGSEYEYKADSVRQFFIPLVFFDLTIENDCFE